VVAALCGRFNWHAASVSLPIVSFSGGAGFRGTADAGAIAAGDADGAGTVAALEPASSAAGACA
jgi:hypothetical protein